MVRLQIGCIPDQDTRVGLLIDLWIMGLDQHKSPAADFI